MDRLVEDMGSSQ